MIKIYLLKPKKILGSRAAEGVPSPPTGDTAAGAELDADATSAAFYDTVAGNTAVNGESAALGPSNGASAAAARAASQDEAAAAPPAVASSDPLKPPYKLI